MSSRSPHVRHVRSRDGTEIGFFTSGDADAYSGEREAEDVAAIVDAIADAEGADVAVWGSSGGASMALAAVQSTTRIGRLILFEPPGPALAAQLPAGLADQLDALLADGDREGVLISAYRSTAESVAAALPDASLVVLDGQGHAAELFASELVVGHVLDFLGRRTVTPRPE
jgi:pimeloyl-ACP methyl ester carboxylesterase